MSDATVAFEIAYDEGTFARSLWSIAPPKHVGAHEHAMGGWVWATHPSGVRVRMHHVITLDPVPEGLGITLSRLVLAIDLDWCRDERVERYFAHDAHGELVANDRRIDPESIANEESHPPLRAMRVQLVPIAGDEALDRRWGRRNGERCDRVGGEAFDVQGPPEADCSACHRPMRHVVSLDSGLPLEGVLPNGTSDLWWGSGGVASCFWCDGCRTSAWSWACT